MADRSRDDSSQQTTEMVNMAAMSSDVASASIEVNFPYPDEEVNDNQPQGQPHVHQSVHRTGPGVQPPVQPPVAVCAENQPPNSGEKPANDVYNIIYILIKGLQ